MMEKTITVLTLIMLTLSSTTSLDANTATSTSNHFTTGRTTTYLEIRFRNGTQLDEILQNKGIPQESHGDRIIQQLTKDRNDEFHLPVQGTKYTSENYSNNKRTKQGLGYIQNIPMNNSSRLKDFKNENISIVKVFKDETIYNKTKSGNDNKVQHTDVQNQTGLMGKILQQNNTHVKNVTGSNAFQQNNRTLFIDDTIPTIENSNVIDHVIGSENYSNSKRTNQGLGYIQNISMNSSSRLKDFKNENVSIVNNRTLFIDNTIPTIENGDVIDHVIGVSHNRIKRSAECPSARQRELCPWRFTRIRKYGNEPLAYTIQAVSCLQTRVTGLGNSILECHPKYGIRRVRLRNCDCRNGDCYRNMNITVGCVATLPCVEMGVMG